LMGKNKQKPEHPKARIVKEFPAGIPITIGLIAFYCILIAYRLIK